MSTCVWCSGNGCGSCHGSGERADPNVTWFCVQCQAAGEFNPNAEPSVEVCPTCGGTNLEHGEAEHDPDAGFVEPDDDHADAVEYFGP